MGLASDACGWPLKFQTDHASRRVAFRQGAQFTNLLCGRRLTRAALILRICLSGFLFADW
jgi:hypothetical protein